MATQIDAKQDVGLTAWWNADRVLQALGSLKFTVVLFAISLLLVLVGTLAQDEANMQEVKSRYFLAWVAMLRFDDLFPQAFFPHDQPIAGVLPIPGGALVGLLLMINLLAAKITRFTLTAKGGRLIAGLGFLIAGSVVAGLIIASGHNSDGLQGAPPISYPRLWGLLMGMLTMGAAGGCWAVLQSRTWGARLMWGALAIAAIAFLIFTVTTGYRIGDPGLRIVWQLLKGVGAGLVLLIGCNLMFGKQGGHVLLHLGVALLMVGQFAFGDRQLEQRLSLVEEEMTNTFVNLDEIELVFMTEDDEKQDFVAVPVQRLQAIAGTDGLISDESLPADVRVIEYYPNSLTDRLKPGEMHIANKGAGTFRKFSEKATAGGASGETNFPAAYVELLAKDSGESLGIHAVALELSDLAMLAPGQDAEDIYDEVSVGETTYQFGLRMHREVKPYWVKLEDVRRVNYSGTSTPRDYSSFIRIVDPETGDDRRERVWMNNPLRYRGETFFQSSYRALTGGKELTGIQVVKNSGWLIPYVACSIMALGMAAHFWGTLLRFVGRRRREEARRATAVVNAYQSGSGDEQVDAPEIARRRWVLPVSVAAMALFAVACLVPRPVIMNKVKPADRDQSIDWYALGEMPTQFGGRIMPLDAYARQTLKALSNKETLPLDGVPSEIAEKAAGKKLSALEWLMEVASANSKIRYTPMFRIDADEVLAELGGLERRENKLYSYEEIDRNRMAVKRQTETAFAKQETDASSLSFKEKKLIELELRKRRFLTCAVAMRLPVPQQIPKQFWDAGWTAEDAQMESFRVLQSQMRSIKEMNAPRVIPPAQTDIAVASDNLDWRPFSSSFFDDLAAEVTGEDKPGSVGSGTYAELLRAFGDEDPVVINQAIDKHELAVTGYNVPGYSRPKVSVERWMESTHPNSIATTLYILALILVLSFFAFGNETVRRVAWSGMFIAFLVHTVVLAARIYVTGRAPVINLYSSAVFIGWGAVLFGLYVERIYRYGTGTLMGTLAGVLTLRVAYGLTLNVGQGDTMPVLQAVLDTQFWLSTHVISVSLGYVATMVAGLIGTAYLIAGWIGKSDRTLKELYSSVYGATCLGILFSTIGTILGGLWADDSWGRFWGWDPKENGALLIVIWNALMLHARWDKMVAGRGFAVLAIGGNIVTAWSWFGTNELGIGLHSYGFTEGTMFWLTSFFATQLAFIIAGVFLWTRRPDERNT